MEESGESAVKPATLETMHEINESQMFEQQRYGLKWWDIWALGITVVIGGDYFSWNVGLSAGFGSFFIATVLMGFAYICLCCSVSELSSAIPFAGGAYGLARCTLGFYPGFIVGASESIEYIFYVAASVTFLTDMISSLNDGIKGYEPLVWLAFYTVTCFIYIYGGKWFWRFNMFLALTSLSIVLLNAFGSMAFTNLPKYGPLFITDGSEDGRDGWFIGGINDFLLVFPLAAWFYVGVESLSMACDDIEEPKINIPKGQISCVLTLFATAMLTLIVNSGLPPGISNMATTGNPFNVGFSLIFNTDSNMILILSIPATFATAFGFVFAYAKMISAMATSKLWPKIFGKQSKETGAPYAGIIFGSFLSYLTCLASYYNKPFAQALFNVCMLSGFVAYTSQCVGYIFLQTRYSNLPREFRSPFGIAGAVFALCVFVLGIICVIFFQNDNHIAISIYAGIIGVISIYYFAWAMKRQTISEQERKVLFVAHVVNNSNRKRRSKKSSKSIPKSPFTSFASSNRSNNSRSSILSTASQNSVTKESGGVKNTQNENKLKTYTYDNYLDNSISGRSENSSNCLDTSISGQREGKLLNSVCCTSANNSTSHLTEHYPADNNITSLFLNQDAKLLSDNSITGNSSIDGDNGVSDFPKEANDDFYSYKGENNNNNNSNEEEENVDKRLLIKPTLGLTLEHDFNASPSYNHNSIEEGLVKCFSSKNKIIPINYNE